MRHMVVVDSDHKVVGMITRSDLTESRLESHWHREVSCIMSLHFYDFLSLAAGS